MSELTAFALAALGGVIPALAWLWFWRREDTAHPEPRHMIALAFLAGMLAVLIVIPMQKAVAEYFILGTTALFIVWSGMEEVVKYLVARVTVLRTRAFDEPVDAVIYMVAVALGFAAVENTLFLIAPLLDSNVTDTILTGNLRFVGATLLHVLSSAVVGISLAISFYKPKRIRRLYVTFGVILAIILHGSFNFLILNMKDEYLLRTFGLVWVGIIVLVAALEWIKRIRKRKWIRR